MKIIILTLFLLVMAGSMIWADLGPYIFRINAGAGYTFFDYAALGWSTEYLMDWDNLNIKVNLQSLFFHLSALSLGVEIGYNVLYYYFFRIPYTEYTFAYREGTVAPINISVLGSFALSDIISILSGAGVYLFENGVTPGIKGCLVFRLPLTKNMAIPFSLVAEVPFGDGPPVTAGATVGFEYSIGE